MNCDIAVEVGQKQAQRLACAARARAKDRLGRQTDAPHIFANLAGFCTTKGFEGSVDILNTWQVLKRFCVPYNIKA